jgi:hypothetical protein
VRAVLLPNLFGASLFRGCTILGSDSGRIDQLLRRAVCHYAQRNSKNKKDKKMPQG